MPRLQLPEVVSGLLLLSVREMGLLSFCSATGFSRFFSKILLRGKRTDQPGSSLILADKKDARWQALKLQPHHSWLTQLPSISRERREGIRPTGQELDKSGVEWNLTLEKESGEGGIHSAGAGMDGGSLLRRPQPSLSTHSRWLTGTPPAGVCPACSLEPWQEK